MKHRPGQSYLAGVFGAKAVNIAFRPAILAMVAVMLAFPAFAQHKVYWSDADSGRYYGELREKKAWIPFRLHGIDAPETRSMMQRGGAKCEREIELGFASKAAANALTRDARVDITAAYGFDMYGRLVVDLSAAGQDVAGALVASGYARVWDYDGGAPKPDWCR